MEIRSTKTKLILLFLGGILMTLCSVAVLYSAIEYMNYKPEYSTIISRNKELALIVSIIGILFFVVATIYVVLNFFKDKPVLSIGEDGFIDNSTMAAIGFISWKEIKSISLLHIGKLTMIGVELFDLNKVLVNKSWYKKKLINGNLSVNYPPITINLNSSREKPEQVLIIMNKYLDEWRKNNEQKAD